MTDDQLAQVIIGGTAAAQLSAIQGVHTGAERHMDVVAAMRELEQRYSIAHVYESEAASRLLERHGSPSAMRLHLSWKARRDR